MLNLVAEWTKECWTDPAQEHQAIAKSVNPSTKLQAQHCTAFSEYGSFSDFAIWPAASDSTADL